MKKKDFVLFIATTFVIILAWIIFNVYHKSIKSTIPEKLNVQIVNIEPNFDKNTLEKLKNRKKVIPLYEFEEFSTKSARPKEETESSSEGGELAE